MCRSIDERSGLRFAAKDIDIDARGAYEQLENLKLRLLRGSCDRVVEWSPTEVWISTVCDESIDNADTFVVASSLQCRPDKEA